MLRNEKQMRSNEYTFSLCFWCGVETAHFKILFVHLSNCFLGLLYDRQGAQTKDSQVNKISLPLINKVHIGTYKDLWLWVAKAKQDPEDLGVGAVLPELPCWPT